MSHPSPPRIRSLPAVSARRAPARPLWRQLALFVHLLAQEERLAARVRWRSVHPAERADIRRRLRALQGIIPY